MAVPGRWRQPQDPAAPRPGSAGSILALLRRRQSPQHPARCPRSCCGRGPRALGSGSGACSPLPALCASGGNAPGTKPASPGSSWPCTAPGVAVVCPAAKFFQQSRRSYKAAPAARFPKKVTQGAREGPRGREEIPPLARAGGVIFSPGVSIGAVEPALRGVCCGTGAAPGQVRPALGTVSSPSLPGTVWLLPSGPWLGTGRALGQQRVRMETCPGSCPAVRSSRCWEDPSCPPQGCSHRAGGSPGLQQEVPVGGGLSPQAGKGGCCKTPLTQGHVSSVGDRHARRQPQCQVTT